MRRRVTPASVRPFASSASRSEARSLAAVPFFFSSKTRFAILWITPPSRARPCHSSAFHTGSSAFLRPRPARSTSMPMYGPTTGSPRAKPAMVPRKSPNSTTMPYASTRKPMKVHRRRMRARPTKKAAVPLAFCLRAKKRSVFCGPMMMVRPMRKRIYSGGKGKVCVLVVFYGFGGLGRGSRKGGRGGFVHCPWQACGSRVSICLQCSQSRCGSAYMARSKKSITPPMRNKPPGKGGKARCQRLRCAGRVTRAHAYRQSRRPPRFLSTAKLACV